MDGDGFRLCDGDCDDGNQDVYPGAPQICDALNNDCGHPSWPGLTATNEFDDDTDTFTECAGDCDDANVDTYPGAAEVNDIFTGLEAKARQGAANCPEEAIKVIVE